MNEPTKTLLADLAVAAAVALAFGSMAACASWPLVKWLEDRRSDRRAAGVPPSPAAPVVDDRGPTTPPVVLSLDGGDLADDPQATLVPNDAAARVVAELEGRR